MSDSSCSVPDCSHGGKFIKGLCTKHYQRLRKHGDPLWEPATPKTGCDFPGCARPHAARGYCNTHLQRHYRTGTAEHRPPFAPTECTIDGCTSDAQSRGYCVKHYTRAVKYGDPLKLMRVRNGQPPETCTIGGCHAAHHARGYCLDHYRQDHHLRNREERNRRAKENYLADPDAYALRSTRRRRGLRAGLTDFEADASASYRHAIKADPCAYCGGPAKHADHVFPVAKGGTDHWWNLTRACEPCNKSKAAHCGTWFNLKRGTWNARHASAVPEADQIHSRVA